MAQPLLAALRARLPAGGRIDVLTPPWVAPVFARMPEVDDTLPAPFRHGALEPVARWQLGRALAARGYACAYVLPNTWKAALLPWFAGIALRIGYVGEARYGLLNRLHRKPSDGGGRAPMSAHYARLAADPGAPLPPLSAPRLVVDAGVSTSTAEAFGFGAGKNAVLCPGAEYGPAKRWPAEHFGALAQALAARGFAVHLLGTAGERALCDAVVAASGGTARSHAGRTQLGQAIDLIARADLVVSNDSGLMHVAAALGVPQVALFGSSSPEHTPPQSAAARVVWLKLECSPCFARACPLGHFRCMRELTVARVLEEIGQAGMLPSAAILGTTA